MDVQVQNKLQTSEQTALSPYKGYVHLPRFTDFPRVSWYARGALEDLHETSEHFSLCASSLLSYSLSSLRCEIYREEKCIARQFSVIIGWYLTIDRANHYRFVGATVFLVFLVNPAEIPSLFRLFATTTYLSARENNPRERTERVNLYGVVETISKKSSVTLRKYRKSCANTE